MTARFRNENRFCAGKIVFEYNYFTSKRPEFIKEEDIDRIYADFDQSGIEENEIRSMKLRVFEEWIGPVKELDDWGPSKHSH